MHVQWWVLELWVASHQCALKVHTRQWQLINFDLCQIFRKMSWGREVWFCINYEIFNFSLYKCQIFMQQNSQGERADTDLNYQSPKPNITRYLYTSLHILNWSILVLLVQVFRLCFWRPVRQKVRKLYNWENILNSIWVCAKHRKAVSSSV